MSGRYTELLPLMSHSKKCSWEAPGIGCLQDPFHFTESRLGNLKTLIFSIFKFKLSLTMQLNQTHKFFWSIDQNMFVQWGQNLVTFNSLENEFENICLRRNSKSLHWERNILYFSVILQKSIILIFIQFQIFSIHWQ